MERKVPKKSVLDEIVKLLDKEKVSYDVIRHKEVFMSKDLANACKVKEKEVAKVLIFKTEKGKFLAGILPADLMAKIKRLKGHIGAKELTLATEKEMKSKTGCPPGAAPALSNLFGISAYIDPTVLKSSKVVFRGGSYSESIKMKSSDLGQLSKAEKVQFTVKPSLKRKAKKKKPKPSVKKKSTGKKR